MSHWNKRAFAQAALAALVLAAAILAFPTTSSAHHCDGSSGYTRQGGEVEAECHRQTPGSQGSFYVSDPESEWNNYCAYQMDGASGIAYKDGATVTFSDQGPLSEERVTTLNYDPTGSYGSFVVFCHHPDGPGSSGFGGEFVYTITDPVSLVDLRAAAKARIVINDPLIETNPSFTDRFTLPNIETWLWIDAGYWEAKSESETAGFVTVEVFATPNEMAWDFSDGTSNSCPGPGTPWTPGAGTADCGVEFTRSSAGATNDAFQGTTIVDWIFTWSLNGADQGPFDTPFLATTNFELQVGEIQAVAS
ncbi:MAG: hypothetical protein ACR2QK_11595 [Acidimicrobiales bacterium]